LQHLRITRIHCELEVEGDHVTLKGDQPSDAAPQELRPGEIHNASGSQFHLEVEQESPIEAEDVKLLDEDAVGAAQKPSETAASDQALAAAGVQKRLLVIDGADQGHSFPLPESGTVSLGKDRNRADLILHDIYVARVNCLLTVEGDKVIVAHESGDGGTMINGRKITREEMRPGDVLRVGNSHLRLEFSLAGEEIGKFAGDESDEGAFEVVEDDETAVEVVEDESAQLAEAVEVADDEVEVVEEGEEGEGDSEAVRQLRVLRDKLLQLSGHPFGNYHLGAVLGRGACGVVFQAEHVQSGQVVALKVISPLFPHGEQELTRFARFMKVLLSLRHPHLVALAGAGKTGPYTWVAREYVDGESLTEVIDRLGKSNRIDWKLGWRVAVQVASALDFAGKYHLRHGKITPANLFLSRNNKGVKLADLMLGSALAGSRLWTAGLDCRPLSELVYLAPEQTAVDASEDTRSDVYSLGAVVYTLLTGRTPFLGSTRDEVLDQVHGPARAPRPTTLNAAIPALLEKVVLKMLAKRPDDRYQTPAELLADLEQVAAG
jgi:hypothetical protein